MEVFDPASNTWDATKADMRSPRCFHAFASLNGELHVVGGGGTTAAEKFDPLANSWASVPGLALPEARSNCCSAVLY